MNSRKLLSEEASLKSNTIFYPKVTVYQGSNDLKKLTPFLKKIHFGNLCFNFLKMILLWV